LPPFGRKWRISRALPYRHSDHLTGQARLQRIDGRLLPVKDRFLVNAPGELLAVVTENGLAVPRVTLIEGRKCRAAMPESHMRRTGGSTPRLSENPE